MIYRFAVISMVFLGSVATIQVVWDLADLFMDVMAIFNLVTIIFLIKYAFAALKDYMQQKEAEKDPVSVKKRKKKLVKENPR